MSSINITVVGAITDIRPLFSFISLPILTVYPETGGKREFALDIAGTKTEPLAIGDHCVVSAANMTIRHDLHGQLVVVLTVFYINRMYHVEA